MLQNKIKQHHSKKHHNSLASHSVVASAFAKMPEAFSLQKWKTLDMYIKASLLLSILLSAPLAIGAQLKESKTVSKCKPIFNPSFDTAEGHDCLKILGGSMERDAVMKLITGKLIFWRLGVDEGDESGATRTSVMEFKTDGTYEIRHEESESTEAVMDDGKVFPVLMTQIDLGSYSVDQNGVIYLAEPRNSTCPKEKRAANRFPKGFKIRAHSYRTTKIDNTLTFEINARDAAFIQVDHKVREAAKQGRNLAVINATAIEASFVKSNFIPLDESHFGDTAFYKKGGKPMEVVSGCFSNGLQEYAAPYDGVPRAVRTKLKAK